MDLVDRQKPGTALSAFETCPRIRKKGFCNKHSRNMQQ